jgi:GMP synthase-like glutamine amidotransferase
VRTWRYKYTVPANPDDVAPEDLVCNPEAAVDRSPADPAIRRGAHVTGVVVQTQDDAPAGLVGEWAAARGLALDTVRVDRGEPLPDPRGRAFAVVLGSSASVARPEVDWVVRVVEWLREADAAGLPVLGICFGAQALAAALGGRVHRLADREIGWVQVESADADLIAPGPWLTWHEDGIELPPLAYELARNAFGVQAFCHCRHLAVQFHPEATPAIAADWARGDAPPELDPAALLTATAEHAGAAAEAATRLFDGFAARAGLGAAIPSRA